ncbi:MAG: DUF3768 domain-containing protein [Gammaproteobacteria bacterium]|nr:DUF3768 domain-containing protein [Gammaproteobacteria bacterium]
MCEAVTAVQLNRIAALNDSLRRSFLGGQVLLTPGIYDLPEADQSAVLEKVMTFDAFDSEDDPYGEHDFGCVEHAGKRYFFKIDYYDKGMEYRSADPANPEVTVRVLTIMTALEY